jgi:hypothetical protein
MLLAYLEYDISKCWHRLKTPLFLLKKKSGPVFLFQIFIIAPLPLPRDTKLYH